MSTFMRKSHRTYITIATLVAVLAIVAISYGSFNLLKNTPNANEQITAVQNDPQTTLQSTRCSVFHQGAESSGAQTVSRTISDGTQPRTYRVHTPQDFDPQTRYPVILSFDGVAGSGSRIEAFSGLDTLPAIVIYPDSLVGTRGRTAWQGAPYSPPRANDIQFVKNILERTEQEYCIDTSHIFTVGMSNGGGFAVLAGCKLGNRIKAVASVSGAYYSRCNGTVQGQSLLVIHSTTDKQVPFDGSTRRKLPTVRKWVADQAAERSCRSQFTTAELQNATQYTWLGCAHKASVRFLMVKNQPHGWLEVPKSADGKVQARTASYIWEFFKETYAAN